MDMILIILVAVGVLGILSIDVRLKKHLENDARIMKRLDVLIHSIQDKDKKE